MLTRARWALTFRLAWPPVGGYRQPHDLLRLWRLTALAHSDPGLEERLRAVRQAAGSVEGSTPIEQIVPGWPDRV